MSQVNNSVRGNIPVNSMAQKNGKDFSQEITPDMLGCENLTFPTPTLRSLIRK